MTGPGATRRTTIAALFGAAASLPREGSAASIRPDDPAYRPADALRALETKAGRVVDVDDFRLAGAHDDTPAFARAVAALAATGGEIRTDPKRRYTVSQGIVIASLRHIAITGANFGQVYDATGPGIAITAPVASLFRVAAPGPRGMHGGVSFRNLSFYDATGSGGTPGRNRVADALLDLRDACCSRIEGCQFHFIAGSVIRTDYFVQSTITGCRIRYCGVAGRNVLHLGGTDIHHTSQSVIIHDTRMEVCYGDAYLFTAAISQSVTVSACTFEAATIEFPASSVPFVNVDGNEYKIVGCCFNRNDVRAVVLRGRGIVTACSFETGRASVESLDIPGARNVVATNTFTDTRLARSVRVTGVLNLLLGNRFFASGGIALEGANNQFHDNVIDNPTMTGGGYCLVLGDYCAATGNHFNGHDFAGSGFAPAVNGVALYGKHAVFTQNSCRGWTERTFIRIENATALVRPNVHDGVGVFMTAGVVPSGVRAAARLVLPDDVGVVTVTGTTPITDIANGLPWAGTTITLIFADAVTIPGSAGIRLARRFVARPGDTLTLASDGTRWYETSRMDSRAEPPATAKALDETGPKPIGDATARHRRTVAIEDRP